MRWFGPAVAVLALVAAGAAWLATRPGDPTSPEQTRQPPVAHRPAPVAAPGPEPQIPAADGLPELEGYQQTLAFRDEVRGFFDGYRELSESERAARAGAILAQVEAREREGSLLPPEALALKLGLLRATTTDPAVLERGTRRLMDAYSQAAQAARRAPDPRDERYLTRQSEIAREVMALDEIPGGVSREAYLRARLDALRNEVYAPSVTEPE